MAVEHEDDSDEESDAGHHFPLPGAAVPKLREEECTIFVKKLFSTRCRDCGRLRGEHTSHRTLRIGKSRDNLAAGKHPQLQSIWTDPQESSKGQASTEKEASEEEAEEDLPEWFDVELELPFGMVLEPQHFRISDSSTVAGGEIEIQGFGARVQSIGMSGNAANYNSTQTLATELRPGDVLEKVKGDDGEFVDVQEMLHRKVRLQEL